MTGTGIQPGESSFSRKSSALVTATGKQISQIVLFHIIFSVIFSFCIYEWEAPWFPHDHLDCRKTTKLHCSWDIAHFLSKRSSGDQANGIHWSWWFSLSLIISSILNKFMFLWPCTYILSNAILTIIYGTHCGDNAPADFMETLIKQFRRYVHR